MRTLLYFILFSAFFKFIQTEPIKDGSLQDAILRLVLSLTFIICIAQDIREIFK